jgi:chromosome segregation ATPase
VGNEKKGISFDDDSEVPETPKKESKIKEILPDITNEEEESIEEIARKKELARKRKEDAEKRKAEKDAENQYFKSKLDNITVELQNLRDEMKLELEKKIEREKLSEEISSESSFVRGELETQINEIKEKSNKLEILTNSLFDAVKSFNIPINDIRERIDKIESKSKFDEDYIRTVENAFTDIYNSNYNRYKNCGSTGKLTSLETLKIFIEKIKKK